jgi:hypothetical protein
MPLHEGCTRGTAPPPGLVSFLPWPGTSNTHPLKQHDLVPLDGGDEGLILHDVCRLCKRLGARVVGEGAAREPMR